MPIDDIGRDDIPTKLIEFHEKVVAFSAFLQEKGEAKYSAVKMRPISHGAAFRIHTWAIVLHKAVLDNCRIGWAQVSAVLLRSLFDCLINLGVIGEKDHDLRAFSFFYHYQLTRLVDSSIPKLQRARLRAEIQPGLDLLSEADKKRFEELLASGKLGGPYWYSWIFRSPSAVLKEIATMPGLRESYQSLSGASHGGHVTANLFLDEPDKHSHEPRRNPRRARLAIVYSSRILLEICRIRVHLEIPELGSTAKALVIEFKGLKEVAEAKPA